MGFVIMESTEYPAMSGLNTMCVSSVIGSQFDARVEATTTVGPYDAVVPSISGRAWITSFNQLVLDPTDPFQEGFVVGRPWEPER